VGGAVIGAGPGHNFGGGPGAGGAAAKDLGEFHSSHLRGNPWAVSGTQVAWGRAGNPRLGVGGCPQPLPGF